MLLLESDSVMFCSEIKVKGIRQAVKRIFFFLLRVSIPENNLKFAQWPGARSAPMFLQLYSRGSVNSVHFDGFLLQHWLKQKKTKQIRYKLQKRHYFSSFFKQNLKVHLILYVTVCHLINFD